MATGLPRSVLATGGVVSAGAHCSMAVPRLVIVSHGPGTDAASPGRARWGPCRWVLRIVRWRRIDLMHGTR
jgi:hypothetical protein